MTPYQVLLQRSILSLTPITIHPGTCTSKLAREGIQGKKRKITSPASRNFTLNAALNLKAGRHSLPTDALLLPLCPLGSALLLDIRLAFPRAYPCSKAFPQVCSVVQAQTARCLTLHTPPGLIASTQVASCPPQGRAQAPRASSPHLAVFQEFQT